MIDFDHNRGCVIYDEMDTDNIKFWFDFKQKKFLHNIDTFYYNVKLDNDFTDSSQDPAVAKIRSELSTLKKSLNSSMGVNSFSYFVPELGNLNYIPGFYPPFYDYHLESPDQFDIYIADTVPHSASGDDSVTTEIHVQIRSYFLWIYGVDGAFQESYKFVKAIVAKYGLKIAFTQENRCDFCWHSNYFLKPSSFFNSENFYKMRVSPYTSAFQHTYAVGSEGYEQDYLSLGSRGGKCFIRIYHKTKEVIEEGYKAFFFNIWLFNGLINRFDLYCYEEAYKFGKFKYLDIARLKWYVENGSDQSLISDCQYYIDQFDKYGLVGDDIIKLADKCTPKLNVIVNVEYQLRRKASKSFALVPLHAASNKQKYKEAARIYDYLDNHYYITEYLTRKVLRLVSGNQKNKSERPYCPFWKALRHAKMVDVKKAPKGVKLHRKYHHELNQEVAKKRAINSVVRYGFYCKGNNMDNIGADLMDFVGTLNDNDLKDASRYKSKLISHLSKEFDKVEKQEVSNDLVFVSQTDGSIYDRQSLDEYFSDLGDEVPT